MLRQRYQAVGGARRIAPLRGLRERCCAVIGDLERILARVALRSARPRDLVQLRASLAATAGGCAPRLAAIDSPLLATAALERSAITRVERELLERAIAAEPAHVAARRRRHRRRATTPSSMSCAPSPATPMTSCSSSSAASASAAASRNLKLGYNRVQGFYIEVARAQAERVPADYVRRQTVKSAERFITPELQSFEDKVLGARERALARERRTLRGAARSG